MSDKSIVLETKYLKPTAIDFENSDGVVFAFFALTAAILSG
jgi:hypothetical protein